MRKINFILLFEAFKVSYISVQAKLTFANFSNRSLELYKTYVLKMLKRVSYPYVTPHGANGLKTRT